MDSNYFEKATILIVDDNPTNLKVLCGAISDFGWEILVATDGESAIEQAEYAKPNLILLDVMMAGMDGFQTCHNFKKNTETQDIPIIFMTALSESIDKVKGLSLGAVDYITKPFQTEEVLARINVHLKNYFLNKKLEEQKQELEFKVTERTKELSEALNELQESQLQLIQTEKMLSLGQLVAGIAHELNNPIGFINGNLNFLTEYADNLINHIDLYQKYYPNPETEITKHAKKIDLEEISVDLPQVISSMIVGIERISELSSSIRNFSRSDTNQKIEFDIHDGLNSTLTILKYRLKANNKRPEIEIIKNYAAMPIIKCYPGQLNQVFMNIISNAIDALDEYLEACEYSESEKRQIAITITTIFKDISNTVSISIKDNGPGMAPEIKEHIFQKFFTTKVIGKGTGLGLSISRQIIEEKHKGKINCFSTSGDGTEFIIEIPSF
jgi:signal transduction histidine kinase